MQQIDDAINLQRKTIVEPEALDRIVSQLNLVNDAIENAEYWRVHFPTSLREGKLQHIIKMGRRHCCWSLC